MVTSRIKSLQLSVLELSDNLFTSPRTEGFAEDSTYEAGLSFVHLIRLSLKLSVCVSIRMSMVLMARGANRHTKDFNRKC